MSDLTNRVKTYIDKRRSVSFENLSCFLEIDPKDLKPVIYELEREEFIRLSSSSCSLNCSSCSTCGDENKERITNNTIIISLKLRAGVAI